MAARRGLEDGAAPPPGGGPGPGPGGGMHGGKRGCSNRSPAPPGAAENPRGRQQVLLEEEEEEETDFLSLCQDDLFDLDGDDEAGDEEEMFLQNEVLLETMASYMDASIISIIEDLSGVGESKVTSEDQNEVSLLTALTEILDNADSENPSPFDTIPDSELLVSPRESASLHKLLGFSRSSPESDVDDQWGPKTRSMTPTIGRVEMCLSDSSWDLPPSPFLETSSPKIPGWKTPRSRPRWGQLSPLQRSDGEEEEDARLGRDRITTVGPSVDDTEDFPMHLACPEEEEEEAAPVGDESISSLSELIRAMHPYCLPNLTVCLDSPGDEHEEQTEELMLAEGGMVVEILGQGSMSGEALEIPVVLRHLPPPGQPMEELETDLTQQLLESDLEAEPIVPGITEGGREEPTCPVLPADEVMAASVDGPKGPSTDVSSDTQKSQRGHRSRRKKNESLLLPDRDGDRSYIRKLRSSSRSQSTPDSQSSEQTLEGVSKVAQSSCSRRKPRPRVAEPKVMLSVGKPDSAEPDSASLSPVGQSDLAKEEPLTLCSSNAEMSLASGNCDQSQTPEPSLTNPQSEGVVSSSKAECNANTGPQEAKPRPLSLSEYWQRRQQRQADEQVPEPQTPAGKWPSIKETPTELAEIPCLIVPSKTAEQQSLEVPSRPSAPGMARQRTAQKPGPKLPAGSMPSSLASPETDLPLPAKHTSLVRQSVPSTTSIPPAVPPAAPMPPARPPTVSLPLTIPMPPALPPTMPPCPGGPGMPSMVPISSSGQTMPDLLLPTLPPPCLPRPPDSYTQFAPVPSWPCYPSVPPSVNYPCLPPPVPGTSSAYPLPSTPAVPWALPPAPVTTYSSDHSYGPVGWGPGPQPPYWPAVTPTPLPPPPPPVLAQSIPPPTQVTDSFSNGTRDSVPASSAMSVVSPPKLVPASQEPSQAAPSRAEVKQGPVSQQPLRPLSPKPKPRLATLESPGARKKGVPVEELMLQKGQPMSEGSAPQNIQPGAKESGHSESPLVPADATVPVPKQCQVAKMPSVHPSRLRRLNFLPSTHPQGSEDVVQAFISEIGIEASDLSSLLEQFEKSEVKKECIPVGPADTLAIGNSGVDNSQEKRPLDRLQAPELANVAGLTPPATPPHQLWKPLAAVSLLAKPGSPDSPTQDRVQKPVGNMEAKRAAAARLRGRVPGPSPVHVGSGDHDYCILSPTVAPGPELGSRWNVKRHQDITIKPILSLGPSAALPACPATCQKQQLDHRTSEELKATPPAPTSTPAQQPSVLLSPEASPGRNDDTRTLPGPLAKQPVRCYQKAIASSSPPGHGWRGRSSHSCSNGASEASSSSSSSSSSRSRSRSRSHSPSRSRSRSISPPPKRWRRSRCSRSTRSSSRSSCDSWGRSRRRSSSSSSSASSSSSSSSGSRSRSRSPSPRRRSNRRRRYDYYDSQDHYQRQKILQKERAIEERRVVFIGKIPGCMTRSELKHRFSVFGEIEECTIHFRFEGDNYGFVTYRYAEEAFAAIESGHKLRRAGEQPFDLCFGGRRQFCKRNYADLDSNWEEFDPAPVKSKFDSVDFDTLLKQAQKNLRR
ncbi:peroxisome proliferator-activated receptor gamma coactivator-related protein 1 isoform X2 [Trichosurus vulpecula]|uniref:peroxisome proliferator-activated receptor gamma coactivator-related protein 1 isoform X2 n=1 Tax=Trichosurus vulpecula TaxID=9337 RepID=UPI00186B2D91|nr:peroxisome proliferator-activated receptor gamma coactivator-related protein 1 isoform X2 [Trichosurus vulpecula]